jgi:hypothetical protein
MSEEKPNCAVAKTLYEAFPAGDLQALYALLGPPNGRRYRRGKSPASRIGPQPSILARPPAVPGRVLHRLPSM